MFEPLDLFKLGDLTDCQFGFVKDVQDLLNYEGLTWEKFFEEISNYKKITQRRIALMPLFDLHRARLYLKKEVEKINEIESNGLGHNPSAEEESAGINIFEKYRAFLQFDKLTGGDITKIDEIRKLPYSLCFAKLMLEADKAEFESNLIRSRNRK